LRALASPRRRVPPTQDIVDGDLCEAFASLPAARQKAIAADLERAPADVLRRLEETRNKLL
jgi:splicing factor 3B subunit 3